MKTDSQTTPFDWNKIKVHSIFSDEEKIKMFDGLCSENSKLQDLLDGRDQFIVKEGLWGKFVKELP